ncbi:MAG: rhodanese-like domain-containing protein [Bdellovibrionales bacterium]
MKKLIALFLVVIGCVKKEKMSEEDLQEVRMNKSVGVDVRTLQEIKQNPAPGSVHIDMSEIAERFEKEFPVKSLHIALFCEVGGRAERVKEFLETRGYSNLKNIGSWREWNSINVN